MTMDYANKQRRRRRFILSALATGLTAGLCSSRAVSAAMDDKVFVKNRGRNVPESQSNTGALALFLCGDVMTGRGIDQILPHPGSPILYEGYMKSALGYVALAEEANGPIPKPVEYSYIWGDALAELERRR